MISINENLAVEVLKYNWALTELGYSPINMMHLRKMLDYSQSKNVNERIIIALVATESSFNPRAIHYNQGSYDYGYFQLNSLWHDQHKSDVNKHIETGIDHYKWCFESEGRNILKGLSKYNTGGTVSPVGTQYANLVLRNKRLIDGKTSDFELQRTSNKSR